MLTDTLVLTVSHSENSQKKTCMVKCNFSKAIISRTKAYYFAIKEMLTIILFSFSANSLTVFNLCKQEDIKLYYYLLASIQWV